MEEVFVNVSKRLEIFNNDSNDLLMNYLLSNKAVREEWIKVNLSKYFSLFKNWSPTNDELKAIVLLSYYVDTKVESEQYLYNPERFVGLNKKQRSGQGLSLNSVPSAFILEYKNENGKLVKIRLDEFTEKQSKGVKQLFGAVIAQEITLRNTESIKIHQENFTISKMRNKTFELIDNYYKASNIQFEKDLDRLREILNVYKYIYTVIKPVPELNSSGTLSNVKNYFYR